MLNLVIISIVFGSLIALAALICGTIIVILKARGTRSGGADSEEAQMIQELYRGLEKMESRIEALETILTDSREKDK